MGTIFEKICKHSGKCAKPSCEASRWILLLELFRKTRETEPTISSLKESSRQHVRAFETIPLLQQLHGTKNSRPRERVSRKDDYQLVWKVPEDGVRGLQTNFFYFQAIKTWNELPKEIAKATSIGSFKNKLDESWKYLPIKLSELEQFIEAFHRAIHLPANS